MMRSRNFLQNDSRPQTNHGLIHLEMRVFLTAPSS